MAFDVWMGDAYSPEGFRCNTMDGKLACRVHRYKSSVHLQVVWRWVVTNAEGRDIAEGWMGGHMLEAQREAQRVWTAHQDNAATIGEWEQHGMCAFQRTRAGSWVGGVWQASWPEGEWRWKAFDPLAAPGVTVLKEGRCKTREEAQIAADKVLLLYYSQHNRPDTDMDTESSKAELQQALAKLDAALGDS